MNDSFTTIGHDTEALLYLQIMKDYNPDYINKTACHTEAEQDDGGLNVLTDMGQ